MARKFKEKSRNCFDELISRCVIESIKSSHTGAGRSSTSTATPQEARRRSAIDAISSSHTGAGRSPTSTTGSEQAKCYRGDLTYPHGCGPAWYLAPPPLAVCRSQDSLPGASVRSCLCTCGAQICAAASSRRGLKRESRNRDDSRPSTQRTWVCQRSVIASSVRRLNLARMTVDAKVT